MTTESLTLEAATVIRVPPPGLEAGYIIAVVRSEDGLRTGRLLCSPDDVPPPGTPVEPGPSRGDGVAAYVPVGQ